MQYVAWACNGYSIAPLMDYANNPKFQELPGKKSYFEYWDERMYPDRRASKGYTSELEKLKLDDSEQTLKINLKTPLTKTCVCESADIHKGRIFIF